jgi:CRISPR type I-E-associated protein CasB/Cse2
MKKNENFIKYLHEFVHREDKKVLVAFKQGINPVREHYAYPYLAKFCDLTNERELFVFKTIAALFAIYPKDTDLGNIGSAFRNLSSIEENSKSYETKVLRLLSADSAQEACQLLAKFFTLFKAKGIPFPFKSALKDLLYWGDRSKKSIAQGFWGVKESLDG